MMNLLPYDAFTLQTHKSLSDVIHDLGSYIGAPRRFRRRGERDRVLYEGKISDSGFEIRRVIHYRNSFLPAIRGQFEPSPSGTIVRIRMSLNPLVAVFLSCWFIAWYSFSIPVFLLPALSGDISVETGMFLGMPLVVLFAFWCSFWYEARRSRKELTEIILGHFPEGQRVRSRKPKVLWIAIFAFVAVWNLVIFKAFFSPASQRGVQSVVSKTCFQDSNLSPYCDLSVVRTLTGHSTASQVALSTDGKTLVSGGQDKAIKVWDLQTGQLKRTLQSDSGVITALAIAPDGRTVVSGGGDRMVRIWDLATGKPAQMLKGHSSQNVGPIVISADGKTIVSGNYGEIKLWDLATGQLKATLPDFTPTEFKLGPIPISISNPPRFRLFDLSRDGKTALVGLGSKLVVWDLATNQQAVVRNSLFGHVNAARLSLDGTTVVTTSYTQPKTSLKIWDVAKGKLKAKTVLSANREVWGYGDDRIALSRDRIITSSPAGLKIWNLQTAELEASLPEANIRQLVVSADGKTLIGITGDGFTGDTRIEVLQRP